MKLCLYCVFIGTLLLCASVLTARAEQEAISEKIIRLHIIANSDSEEDQSKKLRVRDAVADVLDQQVWANVEEARIWIAENLAMLQTTATEIVGDGEFVTASLTKEVYPTREYESFSLPAGEYWSLRIVLGEGQGKNWWCVVYPSLCRKASGAMEVAAVAGGFTQNEVKFITEDTVPVRIKFKILEFFKKIRLFS